MTPIKISVSVEDEIKGKAPKAIRSAKLSVSSEDVIVTKAPKVVTARLG